MRTKAIERNQAKSITWNSFSSSHLHIFSPMVTMFEFWSSWLRNLIDILKLGKPCDVVNLVSMQNCCNGDFTLFVSEFHSMCFASQFTTNAYEFQLQLFLHKNSFATSRVHWCATMAITEACFHWRRKLRCERRRVLSVINRVVLSQFIV